MRTLKSLCLSLAVIFSINAMAQKNYTFDKDHTYVSWSVSHFEYSDVTGKVLAEGTLVFDEKKPQNSKLSITADMASNITGIPKLDKSLAGRNYFDAQQFPAATFVSDKITKTGKNKGTIQGTVTIKNISKPLTLTVELKKSGKHPFFNRPALGFLAKGKLKRSDFGMRAYLPGVGDEVTLEIQAEAIQDKEKTETKAETETETETETQKAQ